MRPGLNSLKFLHSFLHILSNPAFCIEDDDLCVLADRGHGDLFPDHPTILEDQSAILVFKWYESLLGGGIPHLLQDIDKDRAGGEIDLLVFAVYLHPAGRADGVSNRDTEKLPLESDVIEVFLNVNAGGIIERT